VKLEIEVDLPREVVDQVPPEDLQRLCRTEIVLRLYADEKIATSDAARLLGLTRIRFLDLLRQRGIGLLVELDEEDFWQIENLRDQYAPKAS